MTAKVTESVRAARHGGTCGATHYGGTCVAERERERERGHTLWWYMCGRRVVDDMLAGLAHVDIGLRVSHDIGVCVSDDIGWLV